MKREKREYRATKNSICEEIRSQQTLLHIYLSGHVRYEKQRKSFDKWQMRKQFLKCKNLKKDNQSSSLRSNFNKIIIHKNHSTMIEKKIIISGKKNTPKWITNQNTNKRINFPSSFSSVNNVTLISFLVIRWTRNHFPRMIVPREK